MEPEAPPCSSSPAGAGTATCSTRCCPEHQAIAARCPWICPTTAPRRRRRTSPRATSSTPSSRASTRSASTPSSRWVSPHAGWAAIELRRGLGAERVPGVVLMDWMVLGTPPRFAGALAGLQLPAWADVREGLTSMWLDGLHIPALTAYVASMKTYGQGHWSRAGREIAAAFAAQPVPVQALEELQPCPTLHLYAQPAVDEVLAAQQEYAAAHPWFTVRRVSMPAATSRCSRYPRTWSSRSRSLCAGWDDGPRDPTSDSSAPPGGESHGVPQTNRWVGASGTVLPWLPNCLPAPVSSSSAAASSAPRSPTTWPTRAGPTSSCSSETGSPPAPPGTRPG